MKTIMIGLDLAKSVFQVHGVDGVGQVFVRKRLKRGQVEKFFAKLAPAVVGMEACGGAHHWGRVLQAMGHEVRLMPAAYVKPYVKRNKTDGRDAEAICEAMQRPSMRLVAVKRPEQQAILAVHRTRALFVRQRTMTANALRAAFAEFGLVRPVGNKGLAELMALLPEPEGVPAAAHGAVMMLARKWQALDADIKVLERQIVQSVRSNEGARRIMAIPGVGPITASAVVAAVPDMKQFRSGRGFAAWLGLTPRQNNSAFTRRSGGISKQGQRDIRCLLILGASSHLRQEKARRRMKAPTNPWLTGLLARRPVKVAAVAQAAKTARIIWALLAKDQCYRAPAQLQHAA
ncbi:MAG: IS110 family transposase [Rhodospirillaceae bacterium]|nr:IS110 family transposase [Rhodospirillaceae bacterium]